MTQSVSKNRINKILFQTEFFFSVKQALFVLEKEMKI